MSKKQKNHICFLTYRFCSGWDVLDNHFALGAQVLSTQRSFAFLIQVHVLLKTEPGICSFRLEIEEHFKFRKPYNREEAEKYISRTAWNFHFQ